jgi:hypothetical protein
MVIPEASVTGIITEKARQGRYDSLLTGCQK